MLYALQVSKNEASFEFMEYDMVRWLFSTAPRNGDFLESSAILSISIQCSNIHRKAEHIIATPRRNWAAVFGDCDHDHHMGENTTSGYAHCLIFPEAKPDHFVYTVLFTKFFILVDDKVEDLTLEMDPEFAVERTLVPAIRNLLKTDYICGCHVLNAWQYWLVNVDSKGLEDLDTFEDLREFRIINYGLIYVIDNLIPQG